MSFFFQKKKIGNKSGLKISVDTLHRLECRACPLNTAPVHNPKMAPFGSSRPLFYFLGGVPDEVDDIRGRHFVSNAGKLLRSQIPVKYKKKVRFNNCIRTFPGVGKFPTEQEIQCCLPSIVRDIEKTRPKIIVGIGRIPLNWAIKTTNTSGWRGRLMPIKIGNHTCWYSQIFNPEYILRKTRNNQNPIDTMLGDVFRRDLENLFKCIEDISDPIVEDLTSLYDGINIYWGKNGDKDIFTIKKFFKYLEKQPVVAFDFETNGLRPYKTDSKILSISIGTTKSVIAIALDHRGALWSKKQKKLLKTLIINFLLNETITKIAHNLSFELEWTSLLDEEIIYGSNWGDTMAQAYCIDERKGALKLDFLCRQYFGFDLKAQSDIDVVQLDFDPIERVLKYNALDSKYCHKLFLKQREILHKLKLEEIYDEEVRRLPTMVMTQRRGIVVDQAVVSEYQDKLKTEIDGLLSDIHELAVVKKFEKMERPFNPSSNKDVLRIFKKYLKSDVVMTSNSVDKKVLGLLDDELARLIVKFRNRLKMKSTYVDSFELGVGKYIYADGLIHTSLNTIFVSTGRLSSSGPNIQNFPHHKDGWVRKIIVSRDGGILVSLDYGQIEARVMAMVSKDKFLCDALWNNYDIHYEWAEKLAYKYPSKIGGLRFIKDKNIMKALRQEVKNQFVFPAFYGAQSYSIHRYLNIPLEICEELMREFWGVFSGVYQWQLQTIEFYKTHGYVECLTGRRRHAPLSINQQVNDPIQGLASDLVIDSMNRISDLAVKTDRPYLQPILNIHDDLTYDLPKKNLDEDVSDILNVMLNIPYDFINVPITVEMKCGQNWYEMSDIGTYSSED